MIPDHADEVLDVPPAPPPGRPQPEPAWSRWLSFIGWVLACAVFVLVLVILIEKLLGHEPRVYFRLPFVVSQVAQTFANFLPVTVLQAIALLGG